MISAPDILRIPFAMQCLIVMLAGAAMALAMPPVHVWPLLFVGLGIFYSVLAGYRGRQSFVLGWVFGFGYFVAGLYWIGNALLVSGNDFKWAWPLAVLGLPVALALFTGLAAFIATRYADLKTWPGFGVFLAALLVSEWLRGHIFTGFPWNLYGYGWAGVLPMAQSVSVFGIYGLTALTALWACLPGALFAMRARKRTILIVLSFITVTMGGLYGWGVWRLAAHTGTFDDKVILRVVQPSIAQSAKWDSAKTADNFYRTVDAGAQPFIAGKTYVVIWPETAISEGVAQDPNARAMIRDRLFQGNDTRFLMTGILRYGIDARGRRLYYNSLGTFDQDMVPLAMYDKAHLVPFGEYIPFNTMIPLHPIVKFSGFTPGPGLQTQNVLGLPDFGAMICYEIIFSNAVVAKGGGARWVVNVTNDGWYGDSPGPYQHLTMAVFRAIEDGVPVARAANTGISAIIDPYGRILARLPYDAIGAIDQPLPGPAHSATVFAKIGNLIFVLFVIGMIGPALWRHYILKDRVNLHIAS